LASVTVVCVVAVLAALECRERRRGEIALSRAEAAYRIATLERERAEAAVKGFTEGAFRRELAAVEDEVKRAEDQLRIATGAPPDWAEQIRAKGYLLFVPSTHDRELNINKAAFAVQQARSRRHVLQGYTKIKTLEELNERVAKARSDESVKQAAYERAKAAGIGFIARVMGRR
jgi:hypothetical protein